MMPSKTVILVPGAFPESSENGIASRSARPSEKVKETSKFFSRSYGYTPFIGIKNPCHF